MIDVREEIANAPIGHGINVSSPRSFDWWFSYDGYDTFIKLRNSLSDEAVHLLPSQAGFTWFERTRWFNDRVRWSRAKFSDRYGRSDVLLAACGSPRSLASQRRFSRISFWSFCGFGYPGADSARLLPIGVTYVNEYRAARFEKHFQRGSLASVGHRRHSRVSGLGIF